MYGTVQKANDYFGTRLHSDLWDATSLPDKTKALQQATRLINNLNFAGEKNAAFLVRDALNIICITTEQQTTIWEAGLTQADEFPRGSDTVVPVAIEEATYELAFSLLDGVDPEIEFQNQSTISEGFASVRDTKDRSFVQEHIHAGIPSLSAWSRLRRYLRDVGSIQLSRV